MKKTIVSFSGGAASFVAAHLAIKKYGKENTELVFCDTLIEDQDLYRFIDEAAELLGCELIKLSDGRDPWQVFKDKRYQGNTRTAHCSTELKSRVFEKYLLNKYETSSCRIVFGFDWTELHRHEKAKKNWSGYAVVSPLCNPPYLNRQEIFSIVKSYGIELPRLYKLGFSHNNCGGFCVKAGQEHYKNLLATFPERYSYHEKKQEQLMSDLPTARPFLRMTIDGKINYLTLKQFREHIENGKSHDSLDFGGCGCFV